MNCIISALACYLAYKTAQRLGVANPLYAFLLLALQPMWLQLSFRTYSEPISALLLIAAVYSQITDKRVLASALLSYGTMIRQEFFVLLAVYGLYLLVKRDVLAIGAATAFPLLTNLAGYLATGDALSLVTSTMKTGAVYESNYPKQGFDHYFLMAPTIFGLLALTAAVLYVALLVTKKERPNYFLIVPGGVYFLLHCLFNTQSISIGASTGGNLRYLIVIAPVLAVMGALALERVLTMERRLPLLAVLIPFVLAVGIWTTYDHNNVVLSTDVRDAVPLLLALVTIAAVMVIRRGRTMLAFTALSAVLFAFIVVKPLRISPEHSQIKEAAAWAQTQQVEAQPVLANHNVFFYFYGKSGRRFQHGSASIDSATVAAAPVGSYIFWDSHYSYRPEWNPKMVQYDYFLNRPAQFKPVRQFVTPDRRFGLLVFQKIAA
ncbi:MAG: hypothetical protein NTV54_05470 [Ignavibacteriales bacterium]|nr:hypothetical protein [Ignavibacteriales bacterium]